MELMSKKSDSSSAYRKAPQAPRRFKSISKMQEYKTSFKNVKVTSFSSQISKEWKELSPSEMQKWRKMAEQDKHRYNVEKSQYTGPWVVSSQSVRKKRPKDAPKRPPSAFLNYCQKRRTELKRQHPNVKNTDISKMLGQEWKRAPAELRQPHIHKEAHEREEYYKRVAVWKEHRGNDEHFANQAHVLSVKQQQPMYETGISVTVPPSPPTPASSTTMTVYLSPRNAVLALPSTVPPKIELSNVSSKGFMDAEAALPRWGCGSSVDYDDVGESLIPTIFPSSYVPAEFDDPCYGSGSASSRPMEKDGLLEELNLAGFPDDCLNEVAERDAPRAALLAAHQHWIIDAQHHYFPNILQGDTKFDPPLF